MGAQKQLHIVEPRYIFVRNDFQSLAFKSAHLVAVMHDIAQTVEQPRPIDFFLGFLNGRGHTEAEAGAGIDFYFCHI